MVRYLKGKTTYENLASTTTTGPYLEVTGEHHDPFGNNMIYTDLLVITIEQLPVGQYLTSQTEDMLRLKTTTLVYQTLIKFIHVSLS